MSYFNRLKTFLLTLICFPFSFLIWYISFGLLIVVGGYFIFQFFVIESNLCQDGRSSYFLKPNKNFGRLSSYSYTEKVKNDVYDNHGNKVGTVETDGKTHSGWDSDDRLYVGKGAMFIVYMLAFPFLKIGALIASFLALFTNRFYVSVKAPEDYSHEKYNRSLHCLLNIVVERSEKGREKYIQKEKEKKEKLRIKKLKKNTKEKNKEKNVQSADKILGIVLKILGIIGAVIVLYLIVKQFV